MRTGSAGTFLAIVGQLPHWMPEDTAWLVVFGAVTWLCRTLWRKRHRAYAGSIQPPVTGLDLFRGTRCDSLTGLPNRQSFTDALAAELQSGAPAALILLDLDGFAALNSAYGHRAGDAVLAAAADRLRSLMPGLHRLGRLGGDEFAIMLDISAGTDLVDETALRLLRAMTAPLRAGQHALQCSVSMGIAVAPAHGTNADALLRAAHAALDRVKTAGGGGWRLFEPAWDEILCAREAIKAELLAAVEAGRIVPHYQPIINLSTGEMVGLEVLARWPHPSQGLLTAERFIPMAEELLVAGQISQMLMRRVIADARDWPAWLYFAFNVSPGQLRELIGMIRTPPVWPEGALDPRRLEIELTEAAMIEDIDVAREVIGLLQERGARVVLDDFGIGCSNFFHLRELPFDRIKIDKSFVIDIARDPRAQACVRAMLALGQSLGVEMVAEGVESAQTAAFLANLGCRYAQGFYYAEAVPAAGVAGLLRRLTSARPALDLQVAC